MGCCMINPCAGSGCPSDDLKPARLSTDPNQKAAFSDLLIENPSAPQNENGVIIGATIGGLAFTIIVICSLFWYYRKHFRKRASSKSNHNKASMGFENPPTHFLPTVEPPTNNIEGMQQEAPSGTLNTSELANSSMLQPVSELAVADSIPASQDQQRYLTPLGHGFRPYSPAAITSGTGGEGNVKQD
ncbi:hypothetical protein ACLMJK_000266 [Lecanora helva]